MKPVKTAGLALLGLVAAVTLSACGEPKTAGGAPEARRLSEAQYRHAVADVFGADIKVAGRFEPAERWGLPSRYAVPGTTHVYDLLAKVRG